MKLRILLSIFAILLACMSISSLLLSQKAAAHLAVSKKDSHFATQETVRVEEGRNYQYQAACLTESCLQKQANRIARAFPDRPKSTWCIPAQHRGQGSRATRDGKWQGLLLVKVPKAASSTAAGVALRIGNKTKCAVQWKHREGFHYANRSSQSFLFAPVRLPALRSISAIWFFMVTPLNISTSDSSIIRSLHTQRGGKTMGKGGYQYNYMSLVSVEKKSVWRPQEPTKVIHPVDLIHQKLQTLIQSYDFLMVVERMDESLTALALLTGLELGHVLVTSSKVAGKYQLIRVGRDKGKCIKNRKSFISSGVQSYFESDEWLAMNYADEILYRAANISLDLTIDRIGREKFALALAEFQRLKLKAVEVCSDRLGLGCDVEGRSLPEEECYDRDFGCGYKCVDTMLHQERAVRG